MNYDHRAVRILITGKSGTGKTTEIIRRIRSESPRYLFVFDPELEFCRKMRHEPTRTMEQLTLRVRSRLPVFFDPVKLYPGRISEGFGFFVRWCYEVSRSVDGRKLVVVDEIQRFTDTMRSGIPHGLELIMDTGRREEIDTLFASQRPNQVNDRIRSQLTQIVTFAHTDALQLDWLEKDGFNREQVAGLKVPGGRLERLL
jgi:DNA helicase HerA-like ATPase